MAVEQALAEVEAALKSSLGAGSRRRHGRASDDPHRPLSSSSSWRSPPASTGWPTGPGTIVVEWQGYVAETSVFRAFIMLLLLIGAALLAWSALRWLWSSPARVGRVLNRRREKRGLEALSSGIIAIGAGDRTLAARYAGQARKALPNEPLTHLLRAQTAQLAGDRATSRRIFEAMLASPDTEQLGLRGLFLEAQRERRAGGGAPVRGARAQAQPEARLAGRGAVRPAVPGRRLAGRARHPGRRPAAGQHRQDHRQSPARGAAGRAGAGGRGYDAPTRPSSWRRRRIAWPRTWCRPPPSPAASWHRKATPRAPRACCSRPGGSSPHPDLAAAYAYARPGDSPRDRLNRVRHLARLTPHDSEGPIALAITRHRGARVGRGAQGAGAAAGGAA